MPLEGLQLGRYRFIRLLGSGGMGEVYLAEDPRINQQVAIKVIRAEASPYPDYQATKEASRLFQREAIAVAKLDHPHILPLFDYGEVNLNGTSLTYLVMPYRPEGSLVEWLHKRGTAELLSPLEVAQIISQTAEALQHAHDRQIIHQDVKPSNLLIRERREDPDHPDILLADFGIARSTTATSSTSQVIRGTPTYMAPEQWEGHPVFATDQYALAIMAYELLTGRPPFQGGSVQMMYQHLNTQPQPPSAFNTHLSSNIDVVLLYALAKKTNDRFESIIAYAHSFSQATQGVDVSTIIKPSTISKVSSTSPINPSSITSSSSKYRATLTISQSEARTGVSRKITLPGGHQVTVSVPAGAQDGQIIHFERLSELTTDKDLTGTLSLTLAIQSTVESGLPITSGKIGGNVVTSNPHVAPAHASLPISIENQTSGEHRVHSRRRTMLLILVALLIVLGSIASFYVIMTNQMATATSQAAAATATSQAATATATSQAATATATSQLPATATATSQPPATATATSQPPATATATSQPPANTPPLISDISPNSGPNAGGTTVTISGSHFTGALAVSFGSTAAQGFTINSDTQITTISPAGSGTVDVTVTTPRGTSPFNPADQFSYFLS